MLNNAAFLADVSTHSRPKAAGFDPKGDADLMTSFNTQPPEGGWHKNKKEVHTDEVVSTHSRPKAAGN